MDGFRHGLAELGFVEGRNVSIEVRSADGHSERLPALAADIVARGPALIYATIGDAAIAAKAATQTIPVVFYMGGDPIEVGLVASLNRPGGNITGVTILSAEIAAKRVELMHQLAPAAKTIAMLTGRADDRYNQAETRDMQAVAGALGLQVLVLRAIAENEIASAFAAMVEQKAGGLVVGATAFLAARVEQIIALAARHAIPTMFIVDLAVRAGGLMSYGPDLADGYRQAGLYAGRILKGEKPGDLPVLQPTKIHMAGLTRSPHRRGPAR
jgi:putative ABC transport system substrate-binding protein